MFQNNKKRMAAITMLLLIVAVILFCTTASVKAAHISNNIVQFIQVRFLGNDSLESSTDTATSTATPMPTPTEMPISNITGITGTDSISLSWDAIPSVDNYEVTLIYSTNNICKTFTTTGAAITINQLIPATKYSVTIRTHKIVDNSDVYGTASDPYEFYTIPEKVTGLKLKKRSSDGKSASLTFSWNAVDPEVSYQIYCGKDFSSSTVYTKSGTTRKNTYTITGLQHNTNYSIKVLACIGSNNNVGEFSKSVTATTSPIMPNNFKTTSVSHKSIHITWKNNASTDYYDLYRAEQDSENYTKLVSTSAAIYTDSNLKAGHVYTYYLTAHNNTTNLDSVPSKLLRIVTTPYDVTTAEISDQSNTYIKLSWKSVPSATGYIIYRCKPSGSYTNIGTTKSHNYQDKTVSGGICYHYKVRSYADNTAVVSKMGNLVKVSTNPDAPSITSKAGYGKIRLAWGSIRGASGYQVYQKKDDDYELIHTKEGKDGSTIEVDSLKKGENYTFKIVTYRDIYDQTLKSPSSKKSITTLHTQATSTKAFFTSGKKATTKSLPWQNMDFIKKCAKYEKSFVIPGMENTNVAGFPAKNMCPQGLDLSGKYIFISAYDHSGEERSVVYVLSRSSKKLLTVVVLPDYPHAGGVCFDGSNLWIAHASTIRSISFSTISKAIKEKKSYVEVSYNSSYNTPVTSSFVTYYKGRIWTGNYNLIGNGTLYAYNIANKTESPKLTPYAHCSIPSCVQGVAFLSSEKIVFSRSSAVAHQLDVYKCKIGSSSLSLGERIKPLIAPHLNEEIDVYGSYLYINFESVMTPKDPYRSDRIIAIKIKSLKKMLKK